MDGERRERLGEVIVSVGDVVRRTWTLWRGQALPLALVGLVGGLATTPLLGVAYVYMGGVFGASDTTFGVLVALLISLAAGYLALVIGMTLFAGMVRLAVRARREARAARFGDVVAALLRIGWYALFALVVAVLGIAVNVLYILPVVGWIAAPVASAWIAVAWVFVLPLLAEERSGLVAAARRSSALVSAAGWWRTFGRLLVLWLLLSAPAAAAYLLVTTLGDGAPVVLGVLFFLWASVLAAPCAACCLAVLYLEACEAAGAGDTVGLRLQAPLAAGDDAGEARADGGGLA